jgi:hypothetical protein
MKITVFSSVLSYTLVQQYTRFKKMSSALGTEAAAVIFLVNICYHGYYLHSLIGISVARRSAGLQFLIVPNCLCISSTIYVHTIFCQNLSAGFQVEIWKLQDRVTDTFIPRTLFSRTVFEERIKTAHWSLLSPTNGSSAKETSPPTQKKTVERLFWNMCFDFNVH